MLWTLFSVVLFVKRLYRRSIPLSMIIKACVQVTILTMEKFLDSGSQSVHILLVESILKEAVRTAIAML